MNLRSVFAACSLVAAAASIATAWASEGRNVLVEPVKATLDRNWLYEIKESKARPGAIRESDAQKIAADMAASLQSELDKALRAQGFSVVSAPGADVVRISARIDKLYMNAPENQSSGVTNLTRAAGRASLSIEGRDAKGAVILRKEEMADAGDTKRLKGTTDVSNRFWFDALFRDWATEVARDLQARAR